jgi:hypothetical protein
MLVLFICLLGTALLGASSSIPTFAAAAATAATATATGWGAAITWSNLNEIARVFLAISRRFVARVRCVFVDRQCVLFIYNIRFIIKKCHEARNHFGKTL